MAAVTESRDSLLLTVDWERAPGVTAPELAATWCRLEIVLRGRPLTLVEDLRGGGIRRAVHTSAYPLAEWIASRWWSLREHSRPSATSSRGWTWANVGQLAWLRSHNTRAAGGGMPWPDLTVVPEGAVTRLVWTAGPGLRAQPVAFLTSGEEHLPSGAVLRALGRFVEQVLDRLTEAGVSGTPLQREWDALGALDADEQQFAAAAARLGLDPFDVDDRMAVHLEKLSHDYEPELLAELLDSADAARLAVAAQWVERASAGGRLVLRTPPMSLPSAWHAPRPWTYGYDLARTYRSGLGLQPTDRLELTELVGVTRVAGDAAGIQGLARTAEDGVGLALPEDTTTSSTATRFAQARALGISLLTTRTRVLLDPTGNHLARTSRAFAAELLAPADGIADYLTALPAVTDRGIEAVADRFDVSPVLVQRQHDNQLA